MDNSYIDYHTSHNKGWYSRQLDFVLAYPQAKLDGDIYMKLPKGFEFQAIMERKTLPEITKEYLRIAASREGVEFASS